MDEARMQALAEYLSKDVDRTERLFDMKVEDAQKAINADGYDYTVEELKKFAETIVTVSEKSKSGEMNAEELDDVNGGIGLIGAAWAAWLVAGGCEGVLLWGKANRWWR